ncbi:MAG: hypothetical protein WAS56_13995 [Saprospiraceae bacterium]
MIISNTTTGEFCFTGLTFPVRIEFYPALADDYSGPNWICQEFKSPIL